jgi:hypothetical protein
MKSDSIKLVRFVNDNKKIPEIKQMIGVNLFEDTIRQIENIREVIVAQESGPVEIIGDNQVIKAIIQKFKDREKK